MTVSTHILFITAFLNCVVQNCHSVVVQEFKKPLFSAVNRNITVVYTCNIVPNAAHGFSRLQKSSLELSTFLWMGKLCHARGSDL